MSTHAPGGHRAATDELNDQSANAGKALANTHRVEILDLLAQGERSVEVLSSRARMSVGLPSLHLQVLRRAGLVISRREVNRIVYRLAGDDVLVPLSALRSVATARIADADRAARTFLGGLAEVVGRAELLGRRRLGQAVVVDLRPAERYEAGHLPGAVMIPLDELVARLEDGFSEWRRAGLPDVVGPLPA